MNLFDVTSGCSTLVRLVIMTTVCLVTLPAQAHRVWMLPSQTQLADTGGWITVDAAVSNDLFFFSFLPYGTDHLKIDASHGGVVQPRNVHTGKLRTSFDVELTQAGTYRLALAGEVVFASWRAGKKTQRFRGSPKEAQAAIPANAEGLEKEYWQTRVETFVTAGSPAPLLAPAGTGLELVAVTHPNDLYAGETAQFRFLLDSKPVAGVAVEVVGGGTRYRDRVEAITATTDQTGQVDITWPAAGMYWLEAVVEDDFEAIAGIRGRHASYIVTLEVLSE